MSSDIGAQHPEKVLGIMHLSPSRHTFLNTSVLDIVAVLNPYDLYAHVCRCSAPKMLRQREKTEGKANSLRWRRVEVDDPGRKRGVKRKERKQ